MGLKSNTPNKAAIEFVEYLKKNYSDIIGNHLIINDNEVIWEEGPYDWTAITMGTSLGSPEFGNYSDVCTEYPTGLENEHVFAEAINSYSISFHEQ